MLVAVCRMRCVATAANVLSVLGERKAHPNSTDHGPCLSSTLRTVMRAMAAASSTSKERPVMLCAEACRILLDVWRRRRAKLPNAWPERRRHMADDDAASSVQADRHECLLSRRNRCNV